MSRSTKSGFSLIEVMVALGVFSLLSLGVLALTLNVRKLSEGVVYRDQALTAAQNYADQIRAISYNSFAAAVSDNVINVKQTIVSDSGSISFSTINIPISSKKWVTIDLPLKNPSALRGTKNDTMEYRVRAEVVDGSTAAEKLLIYEVDLHFEYKKPLRDTWVSEVVRVLVVNDSA